MALLPLIGGVESGSYTPEQVARKRAMAEALLAKPSGQPIQALTQGFAELADGLMGGLAMRRADREEKAGREGANKLLARLLGGEDVSAGTTTPAGPAGSPMSLGGAGITAPNNDAGVSGAPMQLAAGSGDVPYANETGSHLPRGIRNRNPLNLVASGWTQGQPGYQGSDGRFAQFGSMEQGFSAASNLLANYGRKGIRSITGVINRWAPASDGNNVSAYAAHVAGRLGIGPNDPIDLTNPDTRLRLAYAMSEVENGRKVDLPSNAAPGIAAVNEMAGVTPAAAPDEAMAFSPEVAPPASPVVPPPQVPAAGNHHMSAADQYRLLTGAPASTAATDVPRRVQTSNEAAPGWLAGPGDNQPTDDALKDVPTSILKQFYDSGGSFLWQDYEYGKPEIEQALRIRGELPQQPPGTYTDAGFRADDKGDNTPSEPGGARPVLGVPTDTNMNRGGLDYVDTYDVPSPALGMPTGSGTLAGTVPPMVLPGGPGAPQSRSQALGAAFDPARFGGIDTNEIAPLMNGAPLNRGQAMGAALAAPTTGTPVEGPPAPQAAPPAAPQSQEAQIIPAVQAAAAGPAQQRRALLAQVLTDPWISDAVKNYALKELLPQAPEYDIQVIDGDAYRIDKRTGAATKIIDGPSTVKPPEPHYQNASPGDTVLQDGKPIFTAPSAPTKESRPMTPAEKQAYGIAPNDPNPWIIDETGKPAIAGGRAAQTNINVPPTPEKGYRNVYDDQGRLISQEPIPGGPVARADSVRQGQTTQRSLAAVNAIDAALAKIEGPNAPPQWQTTGILGGGDFLQSVPWLGQPAKDLANTLNTVKSSVTIETLQQMRQSSPTGGALGAVSNYEDQLLGNAKTNIEQSTNGAELAHNLKYLKALIQYEVDGVPGITPQQWQVMPDDQKAQAVDAAARDAATSNAPDPNGAALDKARAAIAAGAPRAAVEQRLRDNGIDPSGL